LRAAEGSSGSNEDDIAKLIKYYGIVEETSVDENLQAQANAQDVNQHNQFSGGQDPDNLDTDNEGTSNPVKSEITN
jgi:hypothetical protein